MAAPHTLKRFVESFPGSSFPTLSETEAGGTWVVKMRGAGNGADCLVSEYLVNRIAHQAGLPVPDACIIEIPGGHPWTFGTDEFDDIVQKSTGPNLGLTLIPDARRTVPEGYDSLAADMISQMVTLDLAFSNQDRSRASGNLLRDAAGLDWIVDHGGCRFLFQPQPGRFLAFAKLFHKKLLARAVGQSNENRPAGFFLQGNLDFAFRRLIHAAFEGGCVFGFSSGVVGFSQGS